MAISYTTSGTTLAKIGKKIQGKALEGYAKRKETFNMFGDLSNFEVSPSQREVTTIVDITPQPNGAFISEFGAEANPYTAAPQDLTFTWAFLNHRFTFSRTAYHLGRKHAEAQIIKQSVFQTQKLMEALARRVGLGVYGLSTGVLCETTTAATQASGTYTLNDGFGQDGIDDTDWLSQIFAVGDFVALVRGGNLVTNAVGEVTAVGTGTIDVTWAGSVTSQAADQVVFANAYPQSGTLTLAGATEYNKAPFGLIEMTTSTTLHNLSGSNYPKWTATSNTDGGYLTGTKIKKAQHTVKNKGGGTLNTLIMAQGVSRALFQQTSSAVQFNDPLGMEILGSVKTKAITQVDDDPLCPPGYAWGMDKKAVKKWLVTEIPDAEAKNVEDSPNTTVDKIEGISGHVLSFDFLYNLICVRRGDIYMWSGLTEA